MSGGPLRYLIGVGNYCARDDSVGLRIVEHIAAEGLERGFRAIDLSSNALNLLSYLEQGTDHLLIVDSARMGKAPGDYAFFKPGEVKTRKRLTGLTTHEGDLLQVLKLARLMRYHIPPLTFMGIEPESVDHELGLSATLQRRLPEYAAAAIRRCLAG